MKQRILAIETSCDETAISVLDGMGDIGDAQFTLLSNVVLSQIDIHKEYGGVFPALAKREHQKNLVPVLKEALVQGFSISNFQFLISKQFSNDTISQLEKILEREPELLEQFKKGVPYENPGIDAIAVTHGPGLEPALWVGINFAKALSLIWNVPIVPVNHMEGHLFSASIRGKEFLISNFQFPMLALLVSGGHTELVLVKDWLFYEKIGDTRDDAAGEAFDKVARLLGLSYPGGPQISKLAQQAKLPITDYQLPRPMLTSGDYDFSFSGLKTAVLYLTKELGELSEEQKMAIAYEFENAVVDVLVHKTIKAAEEHGAQTVLLAGGVAANTRLRETLGAQLKEKLPSVTYNIPDMAYTGDNAAMIAVAGYFRFLNDDTQDPESIKAIGNLEI